MKYPQSSPSSSRLSRSITSSTMSSRLSSAYQSRSDGSYDWQSPPDGISSFFTNPFSVRLATSFLNSSQHSRLCPLAPEWYSHASPVDGVDTGGKIYLPFYLFS
uniref:Uncharacterized protein n=1 Tax=Fagus sylvatica TaxID=28930 RepID=A0A2N9FYD4_FAGSY